MSAQGHGIENLVHVSAAFLRAVGNVLLPPNCLACDSPVPVDGQFCISCFQEAGFITAPFCAVCGVPLAAGRASCRGCADNPPSVSVARAALRYDAVARKFLLSFKYADRPEMARGIANMMFRAGVTLLQQADVLVPVPLHVSRLRARKFNQSALLAARLGRLAGRPVVQDALMRTRKTVPLAGLGLAARQLELADAIAVRGNFAAAGRRVLLIDDICTSGTTAHNCALALRAAGAADVMLLTAARVADGRFD
jgi:ComF family protein